VKLRWKIPYHLLKRFVLLAFHVDVTGRDNLPKKGACIIASNHISYLDPPLLGFASGRELHYLAKEGLFTEANKAFTWLITAYNAIPLRREGADLTALRRVLSLLERGEVVVLFPEGTRSTSGRLLPAKPGLGFVAWHAGVPVIPVYISGANARIRDILLGKERIRVAFGRPYDPRASSKDYEVLSKAIMKRIEELSHGDSTR
jgi:1-acyl-sn-glycerol-3-phosphate acyltransferase